MARLNILLLVAFVVSLSQLGLSVVYHQFADLPKSLASYDFIIAGGGTAGCVLASRLSENPKFNVLLIEAGPDTKDTIELIVPNYPGPKDGFSWPYISTPQPGLNNRTTPVTRGYGLGGSSAINGMVYTRGSADDYDNWARVTGDKGWSWEALQPYIKRHERWLPPAGGRSVDGQFDPAAHGYDGNVGVSLPWSGSTEHDRRAIKNAEYQKEFPFRLDVNAGVPIGVTWMQSTIANGERSSAAAAYIGKDVRERPNLTVVLGTYITRVLPVKDSKRRLDIRTIEIAPRNGGPADTRSITATKELILTAGVIVKDSKRRLDIRTIEIAPRNGGPADTRSITATKELILTAGVIGSPQILMNSGIGNRDELAALGITSILHLPDVGEGLTDHVAAGVAWTATVPPMPTIDPAVAWEMWQQNRTGPHTERFSHQILWARVPSDSSLFKQYKDPSTGPTSPHIEMPLSNGRGPPGGSICLLTPHSRGSVKLASSNPFDHPLIDLNLFGHPFDMEAMKEGVRLLKRFYSGPAWEGYVTGFVGPDPDILTAAEFEKRIKDTAITFFHPVGTASMSSKGSKRGVVDSELRVKGASGLRVIDSSVFPYVLTAHTQAAVYILSERAVDLVKGSW
ncbi:pyranose dehydrogenase [Coprinopsis marcescibilis]|nr:pyranose dehydrogenase [Coprinopsis marcescibilis]